MSKTDSLHYQLCQEGAKWLKKLPFAGYKYIAVEIVCVSADNPDIWGTNGSDSTMIEVKVSRSDFLNDKRKFSRQPQNVIHAIGNYRYYLCPKGIINIEDLPESWGLLWYDNGKITSVKEATYIKTYNRGELSILSSIIRREGVRNGIFNYRNINQYNIKINKNHHKKIQDIIDKLEDLYTEIDKIQDEEKKSHDNSLSHLQDGDKSERMPDIIYNLDHAYCSIGDAISYLDDEITDHKNKEMKQTVNEAEKEMCEAWGMEDNHGYSVAYNVGFVQGASWQSKQPPWISVEERLPEDKQTVLCSSQIYGKVVLCWDELSRSWNYPETDEFYCDWYQVDCWMPIPENI